MKKILVLSLVISLFGCASRKYYPSDKWIRNNTITIQTENLKEFSVCINNENVGIENVSDAIVIVKKYRKNNKPSNLSQIAKVKSDSNEFLVTFDGFKNKDIDIALFNSNYEKIDLNIEKRIRYGVLTQDFILSVFTFGIPLLIDPFKSDFYRIKKSSSSHKVYFEFNQEFMSEEYNYISNSKRVSDFNEWLGKYKKSIIYQNVVNHRDSLEFSFALAEQKEEAIDYFISTHSKSNFLDKAKSVKNEMKGARELFELSKTTNTSQAFVNFLSKYPNSLHNSEARKLLVETAEKEVLSSRSSARMIEYVKVYLAPNLSFVDQKSLSERRKKLSNKLEEFILSENLSNDASKQYENYSALWKRYIELLSDVELMRQLSDLTKIKENKTKICDLLFNSLKLADTKEKQLKWIEKANSDFPKLKVLNDLPTDSENILFFVLDNQKNGNGLVKIFDDNYLSSLVPDSPIDHGLITKYNFGEFEYKGKKYNSLENVDYQELNFNHGSFEGISNAYQASKLVFSFKSMIENEITDEISFYIDGKLVKTIYISKGFSADGECIIKHDYSYEFENQLNLTLNILDGEITSIEKESKNYSTEKLLEQYNNLRNNNFPASINQNQRLDKLIKSTQNQKEIEDKKLEEIRLANEKKREQERIEQEKIRIQKQKEQEQERIKRENTFVELSEYQFADNSDNYLGKNIGVPGWYVSTDQNGSRKDQIDMTLRSKGDDFEHLNAMINYGLTETKVQGVYIREVKIGGNRVYLFIPKSISQSMPNSTTIYVGIIGKLIKKDEIQVTKIVRL